MWTSSTVFEERFLLKNIFELQISPETPLLTALNMFAEHKVSALPIVDKNGESILCDFQ